MKISIFFGVILLIPLLNYAQTKQPDTLQLDIKTGQKIILIGDISSFRSVNTDSIIQKALRSVRDSLMIDSLNAVLISKGLKPITRRDQAIPPWNPVWTIRPVLGAGLITDRLSPFMGLAIDYSPGRKNYNIIGWVLTGSYSFINAALTANYSFEKDNAGTYKTYTNLFAEFRMGNRYKNGTESSLGLGYLVKRSGDYFQRNTFKVFATYVPKQSIFHIKPELFITNNFRKVFPGFSFVLNIGD